MSELMGGVKLTKPIRVGVEEVGPGRWRHVQTTGDARLVAQQYKDWFAARWPEIVAYLKTVDEDYETRGKPIFMGNQAVRELTMVIDGLATELEGVQKVLNDWRDPKEN